MSAKDDTARINPVCYADALKEIPLFAARRGRRLSARFPAREKHFRAGMARARSSPWILFIYLSSRGWLPLPTRRVKLCALPKHGGLFLPLTSAGALRAKGDPAPSPECPSAGDWGDWGCEAFPLEHTRPFLLPVRGETPPAIHIQLRPSPRFPLPSPPGKSLDNPLFK